MLWEEKPCVSIMRLALSSMNLEAVVEQPLLEAPVQYGAQCVSDNMLLQVGVQGHCYSPTARDKSFLRASPARAKSCPGCGISGVETRPWGGPDGPGPVCPQGWARPKGSRKEKVKNSHFRVLLPRHNGTTAQQPGVVPHGLPPTLSLSKLFCFTARSSKVSCSTVKKSPSPWRTL